MRLVTLQRHNASDSFGFAVRGGKYSTGCQLEAMVCDASCPNNMNTACLNLLCFVSPISSHQSLQGNVGQTSTDVDAAFICVDSSCFFFSFFTRYVTRTCTTVTRTTASALAICNLEEEKKQLDCRAMFITPFCPRTAPWDRTLVRCTRQITSLSLINYLAPPGCCLCALPVVDSRRAVLSGYQFDLSLS